MYNICFYFIMFYIYSILGWIIECISCSIRVKKIVINRGFLLGNYCPIYGVAAMYMRVFLTRYYNDPIVLFVMAVVGISIIEYIASYLMEKIFKARWWDYSDRRFNLEGRVCLSNAIGFGLLGLLFIYIIDPFVSNLLNSFPNILIIVLGIVLIILFLMDCIVSFSIMAILKNNLQNIRKDSTDDIDLEVKKILSNYYFYLRKLFKSYPKVKFNLSRGESIIDSINKTMDNFDSFGSERKKKIREIKNEFKDKLKVEKR